MMNFEEDNAEIRMKADSMFGCVVFVEMYPHLRTPMKKGMRRITLQGYSNVEEFYHPDYSELPAEADYSRTLYWNPDITPDSTGTARIRFYNNSTARSLHVTTVSLPQ